MNSTPEEFRRTLALVFGNALQVDTTGLLLVANGASLHFALSSENSQRIGALQIACLRVEISVREGDEAAVKELLLRVDRATLRGGG